MRDALRPRIESIHRQEKNVETVPFMIFRFLGIVVDDSNGIETFSHLWEIFEWKWKMNQSRFFIVGTVTYY